jgi:tetratricopeptide (TPR) repeat protein
MTYATDTVTYFFYLIASASSILVLIGWSSMREIKERVHSLADEEITKLVEEYEQRLEKIEQQMRDRTHDIEENREEIGLTQDIQSLWLKAGRENDVSGKVVIYDQILQLRSDDVEALTFKADAVLQLNEAQWAINLCHQALNIDPDNSHAFYQLACAHTALEQYEEAVRYLTEVLERTDIYREKIINDPDLNALHGLDAYEQLLYPKT